MSKNKLKKFAENETFAHVFQPELDAVMREGFELKGRWNSKYFKNDNPLVLELGCGLGEYSVELGRKYPTKNFIGIDIKGARMWRGAKSVAEEGLSNVAFLRTRIEFIGGLFGPQEVDEIWITFPDPQPQKRRIKKRLTSPLFIEQYKVILKPKGSIHLKTDSALLFDYTSELVEDAGYPVLEKSADVAGEAARFAVNTRQLLAIQTKYEKMFSEQGYTIKYLHFSLQ